jgi:urease accessory protein
MKLIARPFFILIGLLLPVMVMAHTGDAKHTHSFADGFAHPFTGWDHWLSFALIGLLASRVRESAHSSSILRVTGVATFFIASMFAGFVAAQRIIELPHAEFAIAGLLIATGFMLVLLMEPSILVSASVAVLMGCVHGYVHGVELAGAWPAAAGMLTASALLAACGVAVGMVMQRWTLTSRRGQQAIGAIAALLGASLLAQ